MKNGNYKILAIESSCDETAAAVIVMKNGQPEILSNIVSSQVDLHASTGGVVPEVASRAHMEAVVPVIAQALLEAQSKKHENLKENSSSASTVIPAEAGIHDSNSFSRFPIGSGMTMSDDYQKAMIYLKDYIDYIAVTTGPGLIGSLLVGYNAAKTLSYSFNKPIIPVNHISGHIYSVFSEGKIPEFPIISLTVSGGHTSLTLIESHNHYQNIGQTLDDAAGEAFDKVAKLLDLGYPGGPVVSKLAEQFKSRQFAAGSLQSTTNCLLPTANHIVFPRPILNDGTFNFSFSGLKTAVLQKVIDIRKERALTDEDKEEICAAFEGAVVEVLTVKATRAIKKYQPKAFILAGGVSANSALRNSFKKLFEKDFPDIQFLVPELKYCGDNAAMIGLSAAYNIQLATTWDKITVDSNLEL